MSLDMGRCLEKEGLRKVESRRSQKRKRSEEAFRREEL